MSQVAVFYVMFGVITRINMHVTHVTEKDIGELCRLRLACWMSMSKSPFCKKETICETLMEDNS